MINRPAFLADAQKLLARLENDLRARCDDMPAVGQAVIAEYKRAKDAGRTGQTLEEWRTDAITQQAVAWVQRQVAFTERPLGEVAAEFNRYGAVPIIVQSERLRELPISGIFNAYDTDSFVAFIGRLDGVEIDRTPGGILVRADSP